LDLQAQALTQSFHWRDAPLDATFAVLGEEVSHSLSPAIHNAAFLHTGISAKYVALDVPKDEFESCVNHLAAAGYIGVNVTMPHKEAAAAWCSPGLPMVNTLSLANRTGFNTDISGFERSLGELALISGRKRALLLGAGGAAYAVAEVLGRRLGWELKLWNRTPERAAGLAAWLLGHAVVVESPDPKDCDLIINATSAGKVGVALPVLWERAPKDALAYDLFYSRGSTLFVAAAAAAGLRTADGLLMLVHQAADSWPCWGITVEPPRDVMELAARKALRE
jgi:shikimate dehydrogenase